MSRKNSVQQGTRNTLVRLAAGWLVLCVAGFACAQAGDASVAETNLTPGSAASELRAFASPQLRTRYYELMNELRCPKCQNQNLADSDAPIATDLRNELFELLQEGYTDQQIREFMTARYGTFVLYQPPFGGYTAALWLLPAGLLGLGATLIWRITRQAGGDAGKSPDPAAQARDRARLEILERRMQVGAQADDVAAHKVAADKVQAGKAQAENDA